MNVLCSKYARPWHIPGMVVNHYLPDFVFDRKVVDLEQKATRYSIRSSGRVSIAGAQKALKAVFQILKKGASTNVQEDLDTYLNSILASSHLDSPAKLRKHFITISHLADDARSSELAGCLIQFFLQDGDLITEDDLRSLDDWEHAIRTIARLVAPRDARQALDFIDYRRNDASYFRRPRRYDRYDDYDYLNRGRRLNSLDRLHQRSRTMPPIYRTPVPRISPAPTYLSLPPSRGFISGLPSPSVYPNDAYREAEMEELKANQQVLADQVNVLAFHQAAVEDAVQATPYVPHPMAIDWRG